MFYHGFAERITVRYGIVVVNWPLPKFMNPSSLGTKTEAELLWNAWETDTAHFYRMTSQEYTDWYAEYQDSITSGLQSESGGNRLEAGPSRAEEGEVPGNQDVSAGTSTPVAASSTAPGPSNFVHMNVVTGGNGTAVGVEKRARKVRSDKGRPRKKKTAASENVEVA